ncbi:hypothetical protein OC845_003863 [Tilletia horrida]|nr:hypothetical protein OC845_003863 [Tilletia horrida]
MILPSAPSAVSLALLLTASLTALPTTQANSHAHQLQILRNLEHKHRQLAPAPSSAISDNDPSTWPVADLAKIQRFRKKVSQRYSNSASVPAAKWSPPQAKAEGLDTTIADSDQKVQDNILQQIAKAIKSGIDLIADTIPTSATRPSTKMEKRLLPASGTAGAAPAQNVVVLPLKDVVGSESQDVEYLAQVQIGSPARTYSMQVDSGSSDAWIASVRCTTTPCLGVDGQRKRYNTSQSSTYAPTPSNKTFELYYSIGAVKGRMIRDTFSFSSSTGGNSLTVRKQTFGIANQLSSDFATDQTDGVLGLGFQALTAAGERTILQNLFAQNNASLASKIVSFYFGRSKSGTAAKSEMRIGATNPALYKGNIHYVPVTRRAYWQFAFSRFGLAGASAKNSVKGGAAGLKGIVDTGTSYIAMPWGNAADFWNAVPNSQAVEAYGYWVYPCSSTLNVNITLADGTVFPLNAADLNTGVAYSGSKNCIGAVFAADTDNSAIFGATFLKSVYTVLDWGQSRIGFAPIA